MNSENNTTSPEKQVAQRYIDELKERGVVAVQNESGSTDIKHLLWMLHQIVDNEALSETKRHRWLGFIQGLLVSKKILNVEKEREATRNVFQGK